MTTDDGDDGGVTAVPNRGAEALQHSITPRVRVAEVAALVGVNPETVRRWARGEATPPADAMALMEDRLGIPMRSWAEK